MHSVTETSSNWSMWLETTTENYVKEYMGEGVIKYSSS